MMFDQTMIELQCLEPRPMARWRLVGIPFAGAGAQVYRPFAAHLPPEIEPWALGLPGREQALSRPLLRTWTALLEAAEAALTGLPPGPFALYGHSLGAELAFALVTERRAQAKALFVGARSAAPDPVPPEWASAAAPELLAGLAERFGPLPASLAHTEVLELVLPALRADLALLAEAPLERNPAPVPLTAFVGGDDPSTMRAEDRAWPGAAEVIALEGHGHYFLDTAAEAVCAAIAARLSDTPR
ncbi:MAG: alpha/beta fold hydrolase [Pseudomonadota bacterium]